MTRPDLSGRKLDGRYVLVEHISSGGMAAVWRATDEVLGRDVAVKILHEDLARDDDLLERFRLEAIASARLGHPAVVRVFDTGIDDGVCFIVMELFRGESAAELLARRGRLPTDEAVRIARTALTGLGHAHAEEIVHRDVKPANILIGEDGSVKVTDFGIAKAAFARTDLTTTGNLLGTAKYLAPEQVSGEAADARSDIYAMGAVLYELLSGDVPFAGETHIATATMRLTKDPEPLRSVRPDVSEAVESVVLKALARSPDDRFQRVDEMVAALDRAVEDGRPARTRPERPSRRERRDSRPPPVFRSWVWLPIMLVILAGLGVAGYVLVRELSDGANGSGGRPDRRARPLPIQAAVVHDPPPGDGVEYDELLGGAIDDDEASFWQTEGYTSPDLGGGKPGVGLVLDLGSESDVGAIRLETTLPGWRFELFGSNEVGDLSEPIADPAGETSFVTQRQTEVAFAEPGPFRYLTVWITEVVDDDAGKYRATVSDVAVLPPA